MPVGTAGTVKAIAHQRGEWKMPAPKLSLATPIIYFCGPASNITASRRPNQFMGWQHPILTDSGGYQVYSLSQRRKMTEQGVRFPVAYRQDPIHPVYT
ncbi:MAG: tRNA-guanine transglycosylase [Bacteroidales bacterium]|nr:tRNA-guanine transglycosylase [Bacteroidales bacterium]